VKGQLSHTSKTAHIVLLHYVDKANNDD